MDEKTKLPNITEFPKSADQLTEAIQHTYIQQLITVSPTDCVDQEVAA